jgi:hypothetical protein
LEDFQIHLKQLSQYWRMIQSHPMQPAKSQFSTLHTN